EGADARGLAALLERELAPHLADELRLAADHRDLARDEDEALRNDPGHVIGRWRRCRGQHDAEFFQAAFDESRHSRIPLARLLPRPHRVTKLLRPSESVEARL